MRISIITLFPEMFRGPFDESIIKHAKEKKLVEINLINIREFGIGTHQTVDDTPYGGGIGMVMRVDVIHDAVKQTRIAELAPDEEKVFLLSASGSVFTQQTALSFSTLKHLILICGHYEGIDARIEQFIDGEISIGDYVLTGGEIPAMVITDSVIRLIRGVLKEEATKFESFSIDSDYSQKKVEHRHYTRPYTYEGLSVPDVLLSGNHKEIEAWRKHDAHLKTVKNRPDLITGE
jgi:tRNA (guanine37-N1)-methyltransferase